MQTRCEIKLQTGDSSNLESGTPATWLGIRSGTVQALLVAHNRNIVQLSPKEGQKVAKNGA